MKYYYDNQRHLVCVPYSLTNLHLTAKALGIGRHWFHRDHYDIPIRRMEEIRQDDRCVEVRPRDIVGIIKNGNKACGWPSQGLE